MALEVISFEKRRVVGDDGIFNVFMGINPSTLIMKAVNLVPSPSIKGGSVKEPIVLVPFHEPVYPGFEHLKVLLIF